MKGETKMFRNIIEKYKAIKAKVVEVVLFVEKEFSGKTGPEKKAAAVKLIDDFIKLPAYLEWVDNIVIGWLIDLAVEKCNWARNFKFDAESVPEIDVDKVAASLTASTADMEVAAKKAASNSVEDRLAALFEQYGITADEPEVPAPTEPKPKEVDRPKSDAQKNWEKSIAFVGLAEGGRNFDDVGGKPVLKPNAKNDKGGPTAYGITQAALNTAYARKITTHNDIVKLTQDEAKKIYKANYWDCYGWGELPWPVCLVVFDATVNHGLGGTAKIAQQACNSYGYKPTLIVDGKWGPKTKAAVWELAGKAAGEFCRLFLVKRKDYFDAIIARDKSQEVFRNGWYNRLRRLAKEAGVASPV